MIRRVIVVPANPAWPAVFEQAAKEVTPLLGCNLLALHHIGSTSIPGIYAKPIIDMLPVVADIDAVDQCNDALAQLGYVAKGEFGIPGRRFFYRNDVAGERTHHIHAFAANSS